tara:strand:+ start:4197 stop:4931 length:735 start_codon:yes stop_codon:yes gene_type:complete
MMQYVRSLIFNILFFIWMTIISVLCVLAGLIKGYKGVDRIGELCSAGVEKLLKVVIGTTTEFRGKENIPDHGQFLVACKHQSAWETISLHRFVKNPTVIMKKELLYVPLFGLVVKLAGSILIDRKKGKLVLEQMIEGAKKSLENNRPIFIFPEGTRGVPGKHGKYRRGIFFLYKALNVPVLPIALNSGCFWPRRGFLKKKGHIVVEYLPPILPGLSEKDFMTQLETVLEKASLNLLPKPPLSEG